MADVPRIFRVVLQVADLDQGIEFYSRLLDVPGRKVGGARAYFDCGPVILALLEPAPAGPPVVPNPDDLYFAVVDLEKIYARARSLGCLSREKVHDDNAGEIVIRPWRECSFYAADPWGNGLCFVEQATVFTGH
jgi:predicted enzyme related to lactoylglutathione lyase